MSLEENRTELSDRRKTERRNGSQSETQRFAATENFTIFMLKGLQSQVSNIRAGEILTPEFITTIKSLAESEIHRIKKVQELRKEKK